MPPEKQKVFFIGHFAREVPAGYVETLEQGRNLLKKQDLASYYDKLHLVVSGPLWSIERFAAIWQLNTGQLDSLVWKIKH
jgi:arabinofuranosyltransferase